MLLRLSGKKTKVDILDNFDEEVELDDIPLYMDEESGDELYLFSDILKADEIRIAKKYGISTYNIFELVLLYADVNQRREGIKQKFRFNKMLFYLDKELQKEYGEDSLVFDKMGVARAGPIPVHLKDDINELKSKKLIDIRVVKDGNTVKGSKENWEKFKNRGSIECLLTKRGRKLAKNIWYELDPEIREITIDIKQKLLFLDTEELKRKVHEEYPEYRKDYSQNDTETFEEFLM